MSFQVKVLYDFDGEPGTSELTITAGEVLTVTREDVGDGWWEGLNNIGKSGLFPEAYVEKIDNAVAVPPPPMSALPPPPPPVEASYSQTQRYSTVGDSDSDWDNDTPSTYGQEVSTPQENIYTNIDDRKSYNNDNISEVNFRDDGKGTAPRKGLNRFTSFVKMMGESYILGEIKTSVPGQSKIQITRRDDTVFEWPPLKTAYSVDIASPKKETKLKGLKSFIAYQLTSSFGMTVSRRYKHFDWLHERLAEKFSIIAIPPLPDKQISGRYDDQFIEHRRLQLQEFINYVSKHPVLSTSDVWQHFLTTTDEKQWKQGKRAAEKDIFIGANFCLCVAAPERELLYTKVDEKIDSTFTFIQNFDAAIKNLMLNAADQTKKYQNLYKKEHQRVADGFDKFGFSMTCEDKLGSSNLSLAILDVANAYKDIGKYYEEQPKSDWEPLYNRLYVYKGLTGSFPDIKALLQGTQTKRKECEKTLSSTELTEIRRRSDVLTCSVLAEMNHFKHQKNEDFKQCLESFLTEQIDFYQKIVKRLEVSLKKLREN